MRLLGIARSPRFSPRSAARDEAIFSAVAGELRRMGHTVDRVSEDEDFSLATTDGVFSMARSQSVLHRLAQAEAEGLPVINSAEALLSNTRSRMTVLFIADSIPIPTSRVLATDERLIDADALPKHPCWVKRGDACAQAANDVRYVGDTTELPLVLTDFAARGIGEVVISDHVEGDLVKFYSVEGDDFFHYYYPTDGDHFSKFGLEAINGAPQHHPFDVTALKACADRAAILTRMPVYGGDCIIRPDGSWVIIDFNDWPSYSLCRDRAAEAIARYIAQRER